MAPIFNIMSLATKRQADRGQPLTLLHPTTRQPLPITLNVLGRDSDVYRRAASRLRRARLDRVSEEEPAEKQIQRDLDDSDALLRSCVVGWSGVSFDGETDAPFDEANLTRLLTEAPWVREQIDEAIADRARYLGNS